MNKIYFIICVVNGKWDKVLTRNTKETALETYSNELPNYRDVVNGCSVSIMSIDEASYNDARDQGLTSTAIAIQLGGLENIVTLATA